MRWIAYFLCAAGLLVAVTLPILHHLSGNASDPGLAELGISDDLEQLAAPEDPEPAATSGVSPTGSVLVSETPTLPMGNAPAPNPPSGLSPVAGSRNLTPDRDAYRLMPPCQDSDASRTLAFTARAEQATDRMPRCDESAGAPRLTPAKNRAAQ
jgi:hypothetical protein